MRAKPLRRLRRWSAKAATLDRFIAPAQERLWALARNLWWSWDHDTVSLSAILIPCAGELNQNPVSLLTELPLAKLELAPPNSSLHSRINYATAACRNTCRPTYLGAHGTPAICGLRQWVLLRGIRHSRIASRLFRRLGVLSGDHTRAVDLAIPLSASDCFTARIFPPAPRSQRLAAEEIYPDDVSQLPLESPSARTVALSWSKSIPAAAIPRQSWRVAVDVATFSSSIPM